MEYSPPQIFRSIQVTDSLKLANTDVLPTLLGLQASIGGTLVNGDINAVNINASGNVTVTGTVSALRMSVGSAPTAGSHLCYKTYVDAISYLTAGSGLTKTNSTLSVNAAQPGITSVGTLTSLSTGAITGTSATFSSAISVGTPTATGHATNKSYVDGIGYITAGTGLTKTSGTLSVNAAQPGITSVGTLTSLTSGPISAASLTGSNNLFIVGGGTTGNYVSVKPNSVSSVEFLMTSAITVLKRSDGTNSVFVDNVTGTITIDNAFGISPAGSIQGLNQTKFAQLANINSVISSTQWAYLGAMNQNVHTTSSPAFAGLTVSGPISVGTPTLAGHATSKTYVDGQISPIQASLTALGTSVTSGELTLSGNANITGFVTCNRVAVASTTPTHSTHLTSKLYVDSLVVTASGNLAKTGTDITLNPSITLTAVTCSGVVTASTAPSAGGHLCNKTYVDGAISSANAQVSTGTFTTGTFSITGLTFNGLSKTVRWSKIGAVVIVSAEFTWSSTTGVLTEADGNTTISTPFNSPMVRSMNVVIQKDSFVTTKMSYMDEASPALKTRVNGSDMPGYSGGATLLFSWTFYT